MKTSIPFEFKRKSMETETTIRSEFQEGKAEQTIESEDRNKSKTVAFGWESQFETQIGKLTIWGKTFGK